MSRTTDGPDHNRVSFTVLCGSGIAFGTARTRHGNGVFAARVTTAEPFSTGRQVHATGFAFAE